MSFINCWDIWSYYSYRASVSDGPAREGGGEAVAEAVGVGPGVLHGPVHDGGPGRVGQRAALEEPERRERRVVWRRSAAGRGCPVPPPSPRHHQRWDAPGRAAAWL